jgi:hypothetical protein
MMEPPKDEQLTASRRDTLKSEHGCASILNVKEVLFPRLQTARAKTVSSRGILAGSTFRDG